MLGKIEDRKISVLKFFNLLNIDQIQELIKKGEEYQEEFAGLQRNVNNQSIADRDNDTDSGMVEFGSSDDANNMVDEYGLINANVWKYKSNDQTEIDIKVSAATPTPRDKQKNSDQKGKNTKGPIKFALTKEEEFKNSIPNKNLLGWGDYMNTGTKKGILSKSIGKKK